MKEAVCAILHAFFSFCPVLGPGDAYEHSRASDVMYRKRSRLRFSCGVSSLCKFLDGTCITLHMHIIISMKRQKTLYRRGPCMPFSCVPFSSRSFPYILDMKMCMHEYVMKLRTWGSCVCSCVYSLLLFLDHVLYDKTHHT